MHGARQLPVPARRIPIVIGGTGPRTLALVARFADWWNVPMHRADRFEAMRERAGRARPSLQILVTLVTDERRRTEVVETAIRRFGRRARPDI